MTGTTLFLSDEDLKRLITGLYAHLDCTNSKDPEVQALFSLVHRLEKAAEHPWDCKCERHV